jgi:Taurine catabolism dioxygenase TauD, TfdA family
MPHFPKPAEGSWTQHPHLRHRPDAIRGLDHAGVLVIWDNTGTMHRAMPYNPDSRRLLTRTKLAGEEPFA